MRFSLFLLRFVDQTLFSHFILFNVAKMRNMLERESILEAYLCSSAAYNRINIVSEYFY